MPDSAATAPWLELSSADGGAPEKTPIDKFPFVIGRGETADLRLDSFRVSREHAAIDRDGDAFRVTDLASTNGTFLNGQRIESAAIDDGDVLVVANIEVAFFCRRQDRLRHTVTQVMTLDPSGMAASGAARLVGELRRTREAILLGCLRTLLQPIVELHSEQVFGYDVVGDEAESEPLASGRCLPPDARLAARMHEVRRWKAVEAAGALRHGSYLFVRLAAAELGGDGLVDSLAHLAERLAEPWRLIVEIPYEVAMGGDLSEFLAQLRAAGIGAAYDGFSGARESWPTQAVLPDYLKLGGTVVRGLARGREQRVRLQSHVRKAEQSGCEIVAVGVRTAEEAELVREMGVRLAQGALWGGPAPCHELPRRVGPK